MLLKELIDIPEAVYQGDFVLKLTEGVDRAQETLGNYVVTPELAKAFDQALGLIQSAVTSRTSKATYLHGSFGSGKSHFMAILHLILQGNPGARGIPELAAVIQKHSLWLNGKRFLLVPYHMIGVADLESGILGQYVNHLKKIHPEAPPPAVSQLGPLLINATKERLAYGDEAFFRRLNEKEATGGKGGPIGEPLGASLGGWGKLKGASGKYNPESFERAAQSPPGSPEQTALVTRLLETVAQGQVESMAKRQGQYVNLDVGLSEISRHAQSLGYDAVILFLDELILWLASRSADQTFVHEQASKLINLVEAQSADRPIPLVSFVARQRDLRELVGSHVPGAERLSFSQSLDWQQGRFGTITLEDRNLPAIVQKRILTPKDDGAKSQLDQAFAQAHKQLKQSEKDILITQDFDLEAFRKVYPFSPALIEALVAVSGVLQRERTALRVLMQLLVHQRNTLELGQIIPVGDLLDEVDDGITALMPSMAKHFENARKLYSQRLLPMLEQAHGIKQGDALALPHGDSKRNAFVGDDRLIKTLLLSALVPEVSVLRELTAERLVALNYGSIRVPIRGRETQQALTKVREGAARVGEIRVGEGANPKISVRISGVDTQSILDQVQSEDNHGNRLRLVRQLLVEQLNVRQSGEQEVEYPFAYRRTPRQATLLFRNIRELPPSSLENPELNWKVIIDFPFDEQGHTPDEDLKVLRQFRNQKNPNGPPARTLCWMPSFFSKQALDDLGALVRLKNIFSSEGRFDTLAAHLSAQDRSAAREQLHNQLSMLGHRVKGQLEAAFGLGNAETGVLDSMATLDPGDQFTSLYPGFDLRVPAAANLAGALISLLTQAMEYDFPAAPEFGTDTKPALFKKVWELVQPATQRPDGRHPIEKTERKTLFDIANPLKIGEMNLDSNVFVLGDFWKNKLERRISPGTLPSVKDLRRWIDDPRRMGLDPLAENLVIRLFADQTNRILMRHGVPYDPDGLANLPEDCVLQSFQLPTKDLWEKALKRAGALFGVTMDRQVSGLTARGVELLRNDLKKRVQTQIAGCREYFNELLTHWTKLTGERPGPTLSQWPPRLQTAQATLLLCQQLESCTPEESLEVLGRAQTLTSETAMGTCASKAMEWAAVLKTTTWELIHSASQLTDDRQASGLEIVRQAREALECDEHVVPLAQTLKAALASALKLVTKAPIAPPEVNPPLTQTVVPLPSPIAPGIPSVPVPGQATPLADVQPIIAPMVRFPDSVGNGPAPIPKSGRQVVSREALAGFVEELQKTVPPGSQLRLTLQWDIEEGVS